MNEYQVRWIPNKDKRTRLENPFIIEILIIKVRDVILKM